METFTNHTTLYRFRMRCSHPSSLYTNLIVSLLIFLISSCSNDEDYTGTATDIHVEVVLSQSSSHPTPEDISPYEEALVINEYQVIEVLGGKKPKSKKIRVAQWAVTNKKALPVPTQNARNLWLTPLSSMPDLNSVYQRNDLDFDAAENIYYDLTPIPDSYEPPKNVRNDYRSDVSRRLQVYWLIREQLKLAVLGNSHSAAAVDPQKFYQPGNNDVPVALSLSPAGSGITFQALLAEQYLTTLPKLEWVIWGVSPRIFNQNYSTDRRALLFQKSPGYIYDLSHWQQLTEPPANTEPLTFHQIREKLGTKQHPWGWAKKQSRDFPLELTPATRKAILKRCRRPEFEWNPEAWMEFQQAVGNISQHQTKVLLFIPPYHPLVAQSPVADGDNTGNADYDELVKKLHAFSQNNPAVYFLDIHQGGKHDFKHEHFSDIDHLHESGAKILTQQLVGFIENQQ